MDSAALDTHWREAIKQMEWTERYSLEWYRKHPITKELLKSDVLSGTVIEFGCGLGTRAHLAEGNVLSVDRLVGVDISAVAIDYATKHWAQPDALWFMQMDLLELYLFPDSFHNGYMLAVIEHIEDTDRLLSECQRVIKPGGKMFVSVTESNFHSDKSHVEIYDKRKLRQKLAAIGGLRSIYVKDRIIYATVEVE